MFSIVIENTINGAKLSILPEKDTPSAMDVIHLRTDGGEEIMRLTYGHATRSQCSLVIA
ncbi:hypothetical protein [Moorena producens]|uniref:hypothetical protein n=1 Tax=Moorena producens TaxID=1155739 RepID=UPI0013140618|nr:hypothetical protein [Moorena producens]